MTENYKTAIAASTRQVKAKAELYNGSSLVATYTQNDAIKSIKIDRTGEDSKFFGFGVSHKFNIKLIDVNRAINLTTGHNFKISIGVVLPDNSIEYVAFPTAHITEVNRDENTNELSITAYDTLDLAKTATVGEIGLTTSYTIKQAINAAAAKLGLSITIPNLEVFNLSYSNGANFDGTESLQELLKAAAEATQTIYFIDSSNKLVYKRLDKDGAAVKAITKSDYITLDSKTNRRLQTICNCTELGDNVSASTSQAGSTQYIRDNAFLELRSDITTLLDNAIAAVGNMTINQVECEWRGDPSVSIGDKIAFTTKDNKTVISYLLNDSIDYDGALNQKTEWNYEDSEETESNPSTLGDIVNQTIARVDKVNKEITLFVTETEVNTKVEKAKNEAISTAASDATTKANAAETNANGYTDGKITEVNEDIGVINTTLIETHSQMSSLQTRTSGIEANVSDIKTTQQITEDALGNVSEEINSLSNTVNTKMSAEDVTIAIKSEISNGVSKVETETGFRLDDEGLTISKTGSEMITNIDEDGMTVHRNNEEVLTANNEGVIAYNLKARTYLIVGKTSRFEDYTKDGEQRTGCFWIGG